MSTPFTRLPEDDFDRHDEAEQIRRRFKVIRSAVADADAPSAEIDDAARARAVAGATDAINFIYAELDNRPQMRAFVDAIIGATNGEPEFAEITDKELAARLGRSTKSVQDYRNLFREVDAHGLVIEIKDHWQHPETKESHPHAYKCKITQLAVEVLENARLSPEWSRNEEGRGKALKDAATTVALGSTLGQLRKPKRRKKQSDAEVVASKMSQAARAVDDAAKRRPMVRNPDYEQLQELRQSLLDSLKKFDEAYGFAADISTQDTDLRKVEIAPLVSSDDPDLLRRVDDEDPADAGRIQEAEDTPPGRKLPPPPRDSTESTTCENLPDPPDDSPTSLYIEHCQRIYDEEIANGATETEARAAARRKSFAEWERERVEVWDRVFGGLTGGKRDG